MHLKANRRASGNLLRCSRLPDAVVAPRCVSGKKIVHCVEALEVGWDIGRVVVDRLGLFYAYQKSIAIEGWVLWRSRKRRGALLFGNHIETWLTRRNDERDDVMHYLSIAGAGFGHLHVLVFFEVGRDVEVLIFVGAACFDRVLFRHLNDHVGGSDTPALNESRRGWKVLRVALNCSAINPRGDRIDLCLGETRIVGPFANVRVGMPGRHLPADDFFFDRSRPGPHFLIAEHREGRRFAGSMTLGATLEKDRGNVLVECDGLLRCAGSAGYVRFRSGQRQRYRSNVQDQETKCKTNSLHPLALSWI